MTIEWYKLKCSVQPMQVSMLVVSGHTNAYEVMLRTPILLDMPYESIMSAKGWLCTNMGQHWYWNGGMNGIKRLFYPEDFLEMALILNKLKDMGVQMEDIQWPAEADNNNQESS